MSLPADYHVHSQFSWDAPLGSMERTCERAIALGLPALAFTEHADVTACTIPEPMRATFPLPLTEDGLLVPTPFDPDAYLAEIARCRDLFPDLRILSGVELSEPHWPGHTTGELIAAGALERSLGSVHTFDAGGGIFLDFSVAFAHGGWTGPQVIREYLTEVTRMIEGSPLFEILAHIDFPFRYQPVGEPPLDVADFEEEFRATLTALAESGRALEINTKAELDFSRILRWWHDVGGDAISFGSDAHSPDALAQRFSAATALAEATGFRPGSRPYQLWGRS